MARIPAKLLRPIVFKRATVTQGEIGGSKYDFNTPALELPAQCAVQSARPEVINEWMARGVVISHKLYTLDSSVMQLRQGDVAFDAMFDPPREYVIQGPPEDMGGAGEIFGIFCNLTQ